MSLNLDDIKYFNVVAKTLNMTRASEILGMTQPTLSYAIKRLENEIGTELLIRLKNGVQLSKAGEEFLEKSAELVSKWEELRRISDHEESITGTFSIGVHPSVALYSLEHFLPELCKKHDQLQFELKHGLSREMTEQVVSWNIDFGIVVNPRPHPDLIIKELCKDEVTLFSDGKKHDILIAQPNLLQTKSIIKKLNFKKFGILKTLTSENLEVISKLASLGVGMSIIPQRVAKKYKNLKKIKGAPTFQDRICLIYRVEKQKSLASKEIIKSITTASL